MTDRQNRAALLEDPRFLEFVMREFEKTVTHATAEDLAQFAFGGVAEALHAYERSKAENR